MHLDLPGLITIPQPGKSGFTVRLSRGADIYHQLHHCRYSAYFSHCRSGIDTSPHTTEFIRAIPIAPVLVIPIAGNFHGMPVYYISDLSDVDKNTSQMSLENIAYIGLRDVDVAEKEVLKKHNVTWYSKEELVRRGRQCVTVSLYGGFVFVEVKFASYWR